MAYYQNKLELVRTEIKDKISSIVNSSNNQILDKEYKQVYFKGNICLGYSVSSSEFYTKDEKINISDITGEFHELLNASSDDFIGVNDKLEVLFDGNMGRETYKISDLSLDTLASILDFMIKFPNK